MDVLQLTDTSGLPGTVPGRASAGAGRALPLLGQGILIAVIDSGVDYTHPDFRNPDGSTRILAVWDQSVPGNPPAGYNLGTEYTKAQIDEALRSGTPLPIRDLSGHGTQVLGIAAGNGRASLPEQRQGPAAGQRLSVGQISAAGQRLSTGRLPVGGQGPLTGQRFSAGQGLLAEQLPSAETAEFGPARGVAPLAHILVVKLGNSEPDGFPRTTELMQALNYAFEKAREFQLPLAVNLSFGNVYGPHNGTGLAEAYLAELAGQWKAVVCVGTGNEGDTAGHTSGILQQGSVREIELGIAPYETSVNIQIWKSYADAYEISLIHPDGRQIGPLVPAAGPQRFRAGNTELLIYYGEPGPFSISQEIYIDFLPQQQYIDAGIWRIVLTPQRIADGRFDMWLPQREILNTGTRFYEPNVENTLTIPSTARNIIAVGAYDSRSLQYAPFSGRGSLPEGSYPPGIFLQKPDIAAPGVNIRTTAVGGGYTTATGTSFAAPFVTGAAAMLMQWGIVNGNDPFLYGEKVRAYLQRGARPLPGFTVYPNNQVGYGALCVRDSLPV